MIIKWMLKLKGKHVDGKPFDYPVLSWLSCWILYIYIYMQSWLI